MGSRTRDDLLGLEFDWLASDLDGHVALFSTAGGGYAPESFLKDTDAHDLAIKELLALPASTTAQFAPQLRADLQNTWRLVADRGLFAFDSDPHGGPYRLVAAPEAPRRCSELPEGVAKVARQLTCPLRFRHSRELTGPMLEPES